MKRSHFLTLASAIAVGVGAFALLAPAQLLYSKGAPPDPLAAVWIREVGVLLIALAVLAFGVRTQDDSPTLRVVLACNALVQLGLLPIEIVACARGVLGSVGGIIPNTVVHVVLGSVFGYYAARCRVDGERDAD